MHTRVIFGRKPLLSISRESQVEQDLNMIVQEVRRAQGSYQSKLPPSTNSLRTANEMQTKHCAYCLVQSLGNLSLQSDASLHDINIFSVHSE